MKKLLLAAAIAACAISFASAQEKPKAIAPAPGALSIEQTIGVATALKQIDTYQAKDKDGKVYAAPYNFGGTTRMAIAVNINRGDFELKNYQIAVNGLIAQMSGGASQVPPEKMQDFLAETTKLGNGPASVVLVRIKEADLKLDENPIPGSLLSLLVPIIER